MELSPLFQYDAILFGRDNTMEIERVKTTKGVLQKADDYPVNMEQPKICLISVRTW